MSNKCVICFDKVPLILHFAFLQVPAGLILPFFTEKLEMLSEFIYVHQKTVVQKGF